MNIDPLGPQYPCGVCKHLRTLQDPKCPNPNCASRILRGGPSQLDRIEQKLDMIETELAHLGSMLHE